MNLYESIDRRKSVRSYAMEPLADIVLNHIQEFSDKTERLDDTIGMKTEIISNFSGKKLFHGYCNVKAPYYLVLYSEKSEGYRLNAGYVAEQIVLYITLKNIGSCYLGMCTPILPGIDVKGYEPVIVIAFGREMNTVLKERRNIRRHSLKDVYKRQDQDSSGKRCVFHWKGNGLRDIPGRFLKAERSFLYSFRGLCGGRIETWNDFFNRRRNLGCRCHDSGRTVQENYQ